jgi:hypothetical protein
MPHIERVFIDDVRIPSVNEISGCLAKDAINAWQRRIGFKAADKITNESRERGNEIGKAFEDILKGQKPVYSKKYEPHVKEFKKWAKQLKHIHGIETHLINTIDMYHGSPDLVGDLGNGIEMIDYKVKARLPDYQILMNEAAYCEAWRVMKKDEIKTIRLVNFHPDTGKIHETILPLNHKWLQDFFVCHEMWKVNQCAQEYWAKNCKNKLEG